MDPDSLSLPTFGPGYDGLPEPTKFAEGATEGKINGPKGLKKKFLLQPIANGMVETGTVI